MRYWIWWNDLVQGPFELDELTSLKAFSEDLMVCMEDREDWLPASRVADLSAAVEKIRARSAPPMTPPPPPPNRPASVTPLQGEFFGDPPGQQPLLDSEDAPKGPFAFRSVGAGDSEPLGSFLEGRATMPFHFMQQPMTSATAVLDKPRLQPEIFKPTQRMTMRPQRVIKESPIPLSDERPTIPLNVVEPAPILTERAMAEEAMPSAAPVLDEPAVFQRPALWPYFLGVLVLLAIIGTGGYRLMDRMSSRSAIKEANRISPGTNLNVRSSMPNPLPTPPSPTPEAARLMSPPAASSITSPLATLSRRSKHIVPGAIHRARRATANMAETVRRQWQAFLEFFRKTKTPVVVVDIRTPSGDAPVGSTLKSSPMAVPPIDVMVNEFVAAKYQEALAKRKASRKQKKVAISPSSLPGSRPGGSPSVQSPIENRQPAKMAAQNSPTVSSSAKAAVPVVVPAIPVTTPVIPVAKPSASPTPVPVTVEQPKVTVLGNETPNPWKGKQSTAIALVQSKRIPHSNTTLGDQAKTMIQQMHEKELLHAAETGERLYLPDKLSWAALEEDGPHYRVYLNFLAMQADGVRVQTRSYQFLVDLKSKEVRTEDPGTQQDVMTTPAEQTFKHNPMATDIESILGGVDTYNKHKMQLIIVKKNNRNRDQRKKIEAALASAQQKVTRAVVYFRRTYNEKSLQNIAQAYEFMDLIKG